MLSWQCCCLLQHHCAFSSKSVVSCICMWISLGWFNSWVLSSPNGIGSVVSGGNGARLFLNYPIMGKAIKLVVVGFPFVCSWVSLSVSGVLRSFRLMISSLVHLILRSRSHFPISSSLGMNWIPLPCRSFISCIIAFNFWIWQSFSLRNFPRAAVLPPVSSFSFSAAPP